MFRPSSSQTHPQQEQDVWRITLKRWVDSRFVLEQQAVPVHHSASPTIHTRYHIQVPGRGKGRQASINDPLSLSAPHLQQLNASRFGVLGPGPGLVRVPSEKSGVEDPRSVRRVHFISSLKAMHNTYQTTFTYGHSLTCSRSLCCYMLPSNAVCCFSLPNIEYFPRGTEQTTHCQIQRQNIMLCFSPDCQMTSTWQRRVPPKLRDRRRDPWTNWPRLGGQNGNFRSKHFHLPSFCLPKSSLTNTAPQSSSYGRLSACNTPRHTMALKRSGSPGLASG